MAENLSAEQIAQLKDKIKSMSPQELAEFQKKQCIFCQIQEGAVSARKIYEDDFCFGILDINPANPGHVLLLPKKHYSILPQLTEEEVNKLFWVAKKLSHSVLRGLDVKGTNILVANGLAAGQKAQHLMVHIIPRAENDGITFSVPQHEHSVEELDKTARILAAKLGSEVKTENIEIKEDRESFSKEEEELKDELSGGKEEDEEEKDADLDSISELFK